jgi:hypothetical protein
MNDVPILADDQSGEVDCAGSCLPAGTELLVLLSPQADFGEAAVIAVDTNSHAGTPPNGKLHACSDLGAV